LIGSPDKVIAILKGDGIFVENDVADLGKLRANEERVINFVVANTSRDSIKIINTKSSCSCTVAIPAFPVTIERHTKMFLKFSFHAPEMAGSFTEFVEINSDVRPTRIVCRIIGSVDPKPVSWLKNP